MAESGESVSAGGWIRESGGVLAANEIKRERLSVFKRETVAELWPRSQAGRGKWFHTVERTCGPEEGIYATHIW